MAEKIEIEIFIVMNEDGEYAVGISEEDAADNFDHNIGGAIRRFAKIKAKMTPATIAEAAVDIPDDAAQIDAQAA